VHLTRGLKAVGKENGQITILFAFLLPFLMLFTGFAVDFGFGFLAKAELAKGCDAGNLAVMLNLGLGNASAEALGQDVFALNYGQDPLFNSAAPTATFNITKDANGNPYCTCTANAAIRTNFIRLMGISTLNVGDYSQATRPPVILSLVLDRTGSMLGNGGSTAMPPAVEAFDQYFIEGTDQLGETSFAWSATNDVPIATTFISNIQTSVTGLKFADGTYSMGGLVSGYNQIEAVANPPVNAVKVVVFFTDGWDNTIQASLQNPTTNKSVNVEFGGNAATTSGFDEAPPTPNDFLAFIDPANVDLNNGKGAGAGFYGGASQPTTTMTCQDGGSGGYSVYATDNMANCNGATTFVPFGGPSDPLGTSAVAINRINITKEAEYTTVQYAETLRAAGITVYAIGLGDDIDETYLQEIANDPASPSYSASEPSGIALFAPQPTDLDTAFQTVAEKILLRLTQ